MLTDSHIVQRVRRLEVAIADHLASIPNTLQTIPGIGPVFAASLIAEIADPTRFDFDQAKIAKQVGSLGYSAADD